MIEAKPYPGEAKRVQSVQTLNLLDTPIQERFERITRMVCMTLGVPMAIFNLLDSDRQHYKSVQGISATNVPLEGAFCTHAIHENDMLLIPDAQQDERFHDNPFVTGRYLNIGFYAGCPVYAPDGMPIGTLCAIDTKPRALSEEQKSALHDLARIVETELRLDTLSREQSDLVEELSKAQRLALVDSLTRLWNREGFHRLMDKEWSDAIRHDKRITIAVADIDHFKKINDTFGHPVGDAVLAGVAKRLLEALRSEDAVARMGGEEFLIYLNDSQPEKLPETMDRIRKKISLIPFQIGEDTYSVTMSFGVVCDKAGDSTLKDFIARADEALYRAKNGGRNKVEIAE